MSPVLHWGRVRSYLRRLAAVAAIFIFSIGLGVLVTQEGGRVPLRSEQLAAAGGIYDFTWSPDGKFLAYVNSTGGGFDIWTVAGTGGPPRRLTSSQLLKRQPRWSPDGKWIAYVVVQHDGSTDIQATSPDGQSGLILTEGPGSKANPVWDPLSRSVAFTQDTGAASEIAAVDLETRKVRRVAAVAASDLQWSPDGRSIAFVSNPLRPRDDRRENEDIFVVPADGGSPRLLTPGTPRFRDTSPSWAPDSRRIVYASEETGYSNIYIVDVQTGEQRSMTAGNVDNVSPRWSPDGITIAYIRNESSSFHIFTISAGGEYTERISERDGVNGGSGREGSGAPGALAWSPDGSRIAFTHSDPANTSDLWVSSGGGRTIQLTNSMPQELRREGRFVWPELMAYRSFDGREVSALVFKPRGFKPKAGSPALLVFRDALDGQHSAAWDPFIQFFVSEGYLVFAPNVRGSGGRGRDFRQLVAGHGGEQDVRDAFYGLDRLASEGLIDIERLGIYGAGTGGYLATAALARNERRFKAAVSLYGIVDAVTAYSYPSMTEWSRYMIGSAPLQNPSAYFERSLVNFVNELRTPIIFAYAANDPSAPFQQLQQFAVQAEVKSKWYDYLVLDSEPGDWRSWRPNSLRTVLDAMDALFEKYLLDRDREIRLNRNP